MDRAVVRDSGEPWELPSPSIRAAAERELDEQLDRVADGRAQCMWIEGEPGTGKTALLEALAARASACGALVVRGDCPYPAGPDLPWRRMLASATPPIPLPALARALPRDVWAEFEGLFADAAGSARGPEGHAAQGRLHDTPLIRQPRAPARRVPPGLAASDHAQRRWRMHALLLELLSRRGLLVLALDDFHHASGEIARQVQFLFRTLAEAPILWILAGEAAPAQTDAGKLREALAQWRRLFPLTLGALSEEELRRLLSRWFDPSDVERLVPTLLERTGGNPWFAREVIRGLIAGKQSFPIALDSLEEIAIPPSLEEMAKGRLQALPAPQRLVLRVLAALGGEASTATLGAAMTRAPREISVTARALERLGLIEESAAGRFHIRQDWLGGIALHGFPSPPASEVFQCAAKALARPGELSDSTRLPRLARALEGAGSLPLAARAYYQAARLAWTAHAQGTALAYIESARRILDAAAGPGGGPEAGTAPGPEGSHHRTKSEQLMRERVDLLAGTIYTQLGPFARAVELLTELRSLYNARRPPPPPPERWAELDHLLGQAYRNQGNYDDALSSQRQALRRGKGPEDLRAEILLEMAWIHYHRGDCGSGLAEVRKAVRAFQRQGRLLDFCRARNLEGLLATSSNRLDEATGIFEDTLQRMRPLGTIPLEAAAWNNLALVRLSRGDLDEAIAGLTRARRIHAGMGQLWREALCLNNIGLVEVDRGNVEAAMRLYRRALRTCEALGDRRSVAITLGNLADALRQTGEWDEGLRVADRALEECAAIGAGGIEAGLRCTRAALQRLLGSPQSAAEEAKAAVSLARRHQDQRLLAYALESAARAAADLGRLPSARARMGEARDALAEGFPLDRAAILISEAEMLIGAQPRGGAPRARQCMAEALEILRRCHATNRISRYRDLLASLGLEVKEEQPMSVAAPALPAVATQRMRIHCFGPLRIVLPDGRVIGPGDWGSNKARSIFAYLLFHRSSESGVARERIQEAIWPEALLDTLEKTFHATLTLLRRALAAAADPPPATVVQAAGCYRLAFDSDPWIDCAAFEDAIREGTRCLESGDFFHSQPLLGQAESLYGGDFLEDCYLGWTDRFRDRYRRNYLDLLVNLGRLALETWRPAEAVEWAEKLLGSEPTDERACRIGMQAHAWMGHRSAALALYRRFATRLKEEIGAEPDAETIRVYRSVQGGAGAPPLRSREMAPIA